MGRVLLETSAQRQGMQVTPLTEVARAVAMRLSFVVVAAWCGCGPVPMVVDGGASPDAGVSVDAGVDAGVTFRCAPSAVPCQDQSTQRLSLKMNYSTGVTEEELPTLGARTRVDARAGGSVANESYLYLRFTPQGLERVPVTDDEAFTSMDWDIAFRRFVIRLNSGVSGPSCVVGARTAPNTTFDGLTSVPPNLAWRTEEYFTGAACDFVPDPSGIGGPNAALTSFWTYAMCVQTTSNVYVLHLRDGRYVKFQVLTYYSDTEQQTCNMTGTAPSPNQAANYRVRWGFLPN